MDRIGEKKSRFDKKFNIYILKKIIIVQPYSVFVL